MTKAVEDVAADDAKRNRGRLASSCFLHQAAFFGIELAVEPQQVVLG